MGVRLESLTKAYRVKKMKRDESWSKEAFSAKQYGIQMCGD